MIQGGHIFENMFSRAVHGFVCKPYLRSYSCLDVVLNGFLGFMSEVQYLTSLYPQKDTLKHYCSCHSYLWYFVFPLSNFCLHFSGLKNSLVNCFF